jgi:hypothetical protein
MPTDDSKQPGAKACRRLIDEASTTLHSETSRSFARPKSGRIAVKVINHRAMR